MSWKIVDQGWGRAAADFATLAEPSNAREYVYVHHRLGVDDGNRLLDVACGSGLAIELARMRGAECAGIDASHRLIDIAADRNPTSDVRVGDMNELPRSDESCHPGSDGRIRSTAKSPRARPNEKRSAP